ncbi:MAG: hypothetical protein PF692_02875 [Kiritimatiellae bacterium]|jgi:hypothetical protein|nr:hypothetical protein [Kiritimatiellia bacterium]
MMKLLTKCNAKSKRGFTVAELMVSLTIGFLISSAAVYLLVQAFAISGTMLRDFYLQFYGRLLREKIVRSVDGHNGLRVSIWESFDIQHLPGNASTHEPEHVHTMSYEYLDMTSDYKPEDAVVKTVTINRHIDLLTQTFTDKKVSKNNKFVKIFKDPIVIEAMDHTLVPRNDVTRVPRHLLSSFTFEVNLGGVNYYPTYVINTTVVNDEQH